MPLSGIRRILWCLDELKSEYRPRQNIKKWYNTALLIEQKNKRVNALLLIHKKPSSCRKSSGYASGHSYIDKQTKPVYDFMIYTFNRVFDVLMALKRVSVDFIERAKISRKTSRLQCFIILL